MKKSLILAAVAGLTLAGCVKDDVQSLNAEKKAIIGFDSPTVTSNVATKAANKGEITGTYKYPNNPTAEYTYPNNEKFIIYAVEHTGNFVSWSDSEETVFSGDPISHIDAIDGWAPLYTGTDGNLSYYFWDNTKKMSFAAISPEDVANIAEYGDNGHTITNFTIPEDLKERYDLMYTELLTNQTSSNMVENASQYYGVPLNFKHALASIHFSLKNETNAKLVLTKLTLKGVKHTATFNENLQTTKVPSWDNHSNEKVIVPFDGAVEFPITAQYITTILSSKDIDESITDKNSYNSYVLTIPQELDNNVTLTIEYEINDTPATPKTIVLSDYSSVNQTNKVETQITSWEMGNRYTYRLVYTAGSALKDIIAFSPGVTSWNPIDAIVVPL